MIIDLFKLEDGKLVQANPDEALEYNSRVITNPLEEDFVAAGYKPLTIETDNFPDPQDDTVDLYFDTLIEYTDKGDYIEKYIIRSDWAEERIQQYELDKQLAQQAEDEARTVREAALALQMTEAGYELVEGQWIKSANLIGQEKLTEIITAYYNERNNTAHCYSEVLNAEIDARANDATNLNFLLIGLRAAGIKKHEYQLYNNETINDVSLSTIEAAMLEIIHYQQALWRKKKLLCDAVIQAVADEDREALYAIRWEELGNEAGEIGDVGEPVSDEADNA